MYPMSFRQLVQNIAGPLSVYTSNELREAAAAVSKLTPITLPIGDYQKEILSKASLYLSELGSLFRTYLLTGGFPRPIIEYFRDRKISAERYEELTRLVFGDIAKAGLSEDIAKAVLRRITAKEAYGRRATLRVIGEDTGIPHNTVGSYLEALEDAMVLISLNAVQPDAWKLRPKSPKKFYLIDPFIFHSMVGFFSAVDCYRLSEETLADEDMVSRLVEGVVIHHLLSTRVKPYAVEKDSFIGFYYSNGKEMDVVYKAEDASTLFIEVKYASLTPAVTARAKLTPAFTVTKSDFSLSPAMVKIPASMLLALLPQSSHVL